MPSVQIGLCRLEKWLDRNHLRFSKAKCQALRLRWADGLETSFIEKGLVLLEQVEHELSVYPCSKESWPHIGLYAQERTQQIKGLCVATVCGLVYMSI